MQMRSVAPMKIAKTGYIIMSSVLCIVGVLFIIFPELSAIVIGNVLGIAMVMFGIIKLIGYFSKDLFRLAFQYDLEFGILLIFLGMIVLIKTTNVMNFVFIAFGIAILADGLFKVQISFDAKKFGITTWWMIMLFAILTGLVGILLVFRPMESVNMLVALLGISLVAEGILNLFVALTTVKIVKNQQPDTVDANYREIK